MTELKIKTSYMDFNFEVEGEAQTVKSVFEGIKSDILARLIEQAPLTQSKKDEPPYDEDNSPVTVTEVNNPASLNNTKKAKSSSSKMEHYDIVPLALSKEQTKEFIGQYKNYHAVGALQAVVVLYYLYRNITSVTDFDINLTYTLMKTVSEKVPKVLSQTLRDIKGKKQYIDKNQNGTYSLTHIGDNYVELELSKVDEK